MLGVGLAVWFLSPPARAQDDAAPPPADEDPPVAPKDPAGPIEGSDDVVNEMLNEDLAPGDFVDTWGRPASGLDAHSPFMDVCAETGDCRYATASDALLIGAFAVGLGVSSIYTFSDGHTTGLSAEPLLHFAIANTLTFGTTFLTKVVAQRPRPFTYSPNYKGNPSLDAVSFFSGHTSMTAVNTFLAATTFAIYTGGISTEERIAVSGALYGLAAGWTTAVAALRVRCGQHYNSDVIVGGIVGTLFGVLTPIGLHALWPEELTADKREPPTFSVSGVF